MRVSVEGGKYTYVVTETNSHVLRYGELWRDATGDKFTYSMAAEIESLREQVEDLTESYDQCGRTVQEYGKTIDQTESRLREVAAHCANLEQQLADKDADNKWLRSAVTLQAEQVEKLRVERDEYGRRNGRLRSELAELDTKLTVLAEQVEKLTKERDEYRSGFEAAASKYRNLKLQMQEIINVC